MLRYKSFNSSNRLAKLLLTAGCLLLSLPALTAERVLSYHSDIQVRQDGSMLVAETIRVQVEGNQIRRGIWREFPTDYQDQAGNHFSVGFDILDVQRNGRSEPFSTQRQSNGVRVTIGSADHMLTPGVHEYRLRYHTTRQLGFFDGFDELYWNVTGSDWAFAIDRASALVTLPAEVDATRLRLNFYTGPQGVNGKDAVANVIDGRKVSFETSKKLAPHEGLTIAVGWPKGIVQEPTGSDKFGYFLADNGAALVLLIGWLLPLCWYLWAWNNIGRDPKKGVIIPLFSPPKGLTPAGCSYISKMSFRRQTFAAAVISLGVKGYLRIEEDDDDYVLYRQDTPAKDTASAGELALMKVLFGNGVRQHIELDQENHKVFSRASRALEKALKAEHLERVFNLNSVYALPAIGLSIAAAGVAATMVAGPLIWAAYALLSIALHFVFVYLLRAPTPAGRKVMDEIEGFRMYLDTAEQDRLDRMRSPELTQEVFEMFLPYAFALEVENHWCERFAREFPTEVDGNHPYNPHWYAGQKRGLAGLHHLGDDFNRSFSSAISSASSPPGSSSGSGGGGFSGGGGGGGGGGGW